MGDPSTLSDSAAKPGFEHASAGARIPASGKPVWSPGLAFLGGIFALAIVELPVLAMIFDPLAINAADPAWLTARSFLIEILPAISFAIVALAILVAPDRRQIFQQWSAATAHFDGRVYLAINIAAFIIWCGVTKAFNIMAAGAASPPWLLSVLWAGGVGALYGVLALAAAPIPFWRSAWEHYRWRAFVALGAGALIQSAAIMSQQSWGALSAATFHVSAAILSLYESDIRVDAPARILGANGFDVNIAAACSGYEGIGLVVTFLAIYLWMFRVTLRFPNAYLALPIGVAAIWLLNSVRIAALISIGAHVSPDIAMTGFHSQAGWMMFLVVTIGIMLATNKISFFHRTTDHIREAPPPSYGETLALLMPFLAMTLAGIIAAAFSAGGHWLYALRVIAISAALIWFLPFYRKIDWRSGWEPVGLGLLVAIAWIVTDPGRGQSSALGEWIGTLPPMLGAIWVGMRLLGTIALVPIAEELTFRGYLHRKIIADKFESVKAGAFSWKALIITTILFAMLHERWLAGGLAGIVFAIALYRSGKISGAIVAHMAANAVIAFWAITAGQWSLL